MLLRNKPNSNSIARHRAAHAPLPRKNRLARAVAMACLSTSLMLPAHEAQAATTNWTAGTADWFTPGNWDNGVPTNVDTASITNGGTAQIATGANAIADEVRLGTGSGSLSITNGSLSTGDALEIGISVGGVGNVTLDGMDASIVSSGTFMRVGSNGTGSLTIRNGASMSANTSVFVVGETGSGNIIVEGAGSTFSSSSFNTFIANNGMGTLTVRDGGRVTLSATSGVRFADSAGSTGTINIDGTAGSRGMLETRFISEGAGTGEINFDGGILRALQNEGNFLRNFEAGDVTINVGGAFLDSNGFNITSSAAMDGTGGLTKQGAGTLTLSGTNTYSGGTTVTDGTLAISNAAALGSNSNLLVVQSTTNAPVADLGGLTVTQSQLILNGQLGTALRNGTLNQTTLTQIGNGTVSAVLAGTGTVRKTNGNTGILTAVNTYTGATEVNSGTLRISSTGSILTTSGITINGGNLEVDGAGGNAIADTLAITNTTGTFTLTGSDETIGSISGAGNINLNGNTLTAGGDGASTTVSGIISGAGGGLTKAGAGTFTLSDANTYTGATTINAGILQASDASALGNNSAVTVGGGSLDLTTGLGIGSLAGAGNVTLNANTLTVGGNNTSTSHSGVISGTGALSKQGTGTLTLSGNNTYTGATTITAGTVRLGAANRIANSSDLIVNGGTFDLNGLNETMANLSGSGGNITVGAGGTGAFTVNQTVDQTYAGNFSGVSNFFNIVFIKYGAATLTLSGTSSQTGVGIVHIGAGRLAVQNGNAIGNHFLSGAGEFELLSDETIAGLGGVASHNGNVLLNGNTLSLNGDGAALSGTVTSSGVISGAGNLVIDMGNDTQSLTATNTYTGTTTINSGTLRTNNASSLGNNSAVTVNAGTLDVLGDLTIGSLAGTGSVSLNTRTLTTGGDNTSTTFSGVLSGAGGALSKQGTGTLTLTGTNTYTGATTISAGTLQIGNGGTTGSITGNVTNNNALTFNRSDAVTFGNVISGTGTFTQAGTGSTNLTGTNTYTGATTINNGTLFVNGSIANSTTTVNAGGILGGTGTTGSVNINGGTFAPGNSIGTTNVTGNVDFTGGGNYNVEVNAAGASDLINATGTATLTSGIVNVQPEAGNYAVSTDYTILTAAGGLGGTTFASVNSNLAFLTPTLSYVGNDVRLNLTRNNVSFSSVANTPNQIAVSTVLSNNVVALQSINNNVLVLTNASAQQAFDSLSGVQHTQSQVVINKLSQQFQQLLFNRSSQSTNGALAFTNFNPAQGHLLADNTNNWQQVDTESSSLISSERGWWTQGVGGFGSIDDTSNASGADYQSGGLAFGVDTDWRDFVVGFAGSYTHSNVDPFSGDSDIDSFQAGAYSSWERNNIYMNATVGLGLHKVDATRTVIVGASVNTATSDYDSVNVSTAIEAGKDIKLNLNTTLTPYVGAAYAHNNRDDFTENGAGTANLSVSEQNEDSLRTTVGLRLSRDIKTGNNKTITPSAMIAYVREHMDNVSRLEAGFTAVPTSTFKVDGTDLDRDRIQVGFGVSGQLNENTTLNVGYNGELSGSDNHHAFSATFRYEW